MKVARCEYLRDAIPGPTGPFKSISEWTKDDAEEDLQEQDEELKEKLDAMLAKVQTSFERLKRKKENDTPQGKLFRTGLHDLVEESRRILSGVGREALELCKQYK